MSNIRVDKYGHCIFCHENMIIEKVIDGEVVNIFTPDYSETQFLLDDGSRMRVCLCKKCKAEKDLTDVEVQKDVMEAVINGWQLEVNGLVEDEKRPEWDEKRAEKHMKEYRKRKIDVHSEDVPKHVIEERRKFLANLKEGG